ncbi:MAG TPA: TlyA family RNA methyltransferase [Solirubrobacteraceae bacterium]|nr:TlyA family RNA methyltransferase [Solirubrobacteraceae bacterium]
MARVRLDTLLAERGLFASRTRAAAAAAAGEVLLGEARRPARRGSQMVEDDVVLDLVAADRYVSRGGTKLANALDAFGLDVTGRRALDVGASTGGFTDVLLQRGAAHVVAVDVAENELAPGIRANERVAVLDNTNARALEPAQLPYAPDLVVADVSFISLTKILPAVIACMDPTSWDGLVMVKPQFELGRERVGKGVVRDPADRREALVTVASCARDLGATVLGFASSGLPGPKGNEETFVRLAEPGRPGAVEDLLAAATEVEPL